MTDLFTWGRSDQKASQGSMYRPFDRRFWSAHWSEFWGTIERDGKITYDTSTHVWASETKRILSMPYAVPDDFGSLVAVMPRTLIGGPDREDV